MVEQTQKQLLEQSPLGKGSGGEAKPKPELSSPSSSPTMGYSPSTPTSSNAPGERATVDDRSIMRCPVHGTFMRHLTPDSHYWTCGNEGCRELRDDRPEHNFGLMLLGFTSKAARP